jgi:hypothetical protein
MQSPYLSVAIEAVKAAQAVILTYYQSELDGQPITYQSTTALATNGLLHDQILAAMNE